MTDKPVVPQPIAQMKITLMNNGRIAVNGFPGDLEVAQDWLSAAAKVIVRHFITCAKAGELDENNRIIEKSIIVPKKTLVDGNGRPLQNEKDR